MTQLHAHLHLHTDASKDGLGTVERLAQKAEQMGFTALAMTDHGTLANAIAFSQACEKFNIKPILGLEAYVGYEGERYHFTLLADGNKGFNELIEYNNYGISSDRARPVAPIDMLFKMEHVILLSGCPASPLNRLPYDEAFRLGARLKGHFGTRFYSELMVPFEDDFSLVERQVKMAKELGIKHVITNDAHFPVQKDAEVHSAVTDIRAGYSYNSENLWLKDMRQLGPRLMRAGLSKEEANIAAENTNALAKATVSVDLKGDPQEILPKIDNADFVLKNACYHSLITREQSDRLEYELGVISEMGYSSYFLILEDIVTEAREIGVRVGPGRGSGAGSYVLYRLGIVDIDPLEFDLSFERFLNVEREGMPDVDIDFESERRDQVLEYVSRRWGAVPIATYSTFSHRSLVRGLAKHYKLPRGLESELADGGPDSKAFKTACEMEPKFRYAYNAMYGQIRHKGRHAGGVVIASDMEHVPLDRASGSEVVAWAEGGEKDLSYAGYVKFDLLGLSALSALRRLEEQYPHISPPAFPEPGAVEMEIFRKGLLAGIFQFSGSDGIRQLTMDLKPRTFDDLVALNALYRPGAIDAGSTEKFVEWRDSPREVPEVIEDILEDTYGAIVYQEQVMEIFSRITGGTLAEADLARRVIFKSDRGDRVWLKKLRDLEKTFIKAAIEKMPRREAEELWKELETHTRYSFNKSHAVCYSKIAWEMAWWKWNYPASFLCAMMNTDEKNIQTYMIEVARSSKITLQRPHVNISGLEYVAEDNEIFMPLSEVKYMGMKGASILISSREAAGKFDSYEEFMERVPKKFVRGRAREGLYHLGGFEGLKGDSDVLAIKNPARDLSANPYELQNQYLGFVIPDDKLMSKIAEHSSGDNIAGIITGVEDRKSSYGPYTVYRLAPHGVFWTRGFSKEFEKGQFVVANVRMSTGRAINVWELSV